MSNKNGELKPLTSLRFFAALIIVVLHMKKNFPFVDPLVAAVPLVQGVSFFFVLSGFILYYRYQALSATTSYGKFLFNRFARIWPTHILATVFAVLLLSEAVINPFAAEGWEEVKIVLSNLTLVQAWIPNAKYYFSLNSVAWSISTEAFFYLTYPLLAVATVRYGGWTPLATGFLALITVSIALYFGWPSYNGVLYDGLTLSGLLKAQPLVRLLEFALGIWAGHLFLKKPMKKSGTPQEVLALLAILGSVLATGLLAHTIGKEYGWKYIANNWLWNSGSSLVFTWAVYVFAHGEGRLSEWLGHKILVTLGGASFALYLFHQPIMLWFNAQGKSFPGIPGFLNLPVYLALSIGTSLIVYWYFETPSRQVLLNMVKKMGETSSLKKARALFN